MSFPQTIQKHEEIIFSTLGKKKKKKKERKEKKNCFIKYHRLFVLFTFTVPTVLGNKNCMKTVTETSNNRASSDILYRIPIKKIQ